MGKVHVYLDEDEMSHGKIRGPEIECIFYQKATEIDGTIQSPAADLSVA